MDKILKLRSVITDVIFSSDSNELLTYNIDLKLLKLAKGGEDINSFELFANEDLRFQTQDFGKFYLNDEGFVINVPNAINLIGTFNNTFTISDEGFSFSTPSEDLLQLWSGSAYFKIPIIFSPYTTALRPENMLEGAVIYDSTLKKCILYNGTAWVNLDGTALA